jgi:hypothetical protein
MVFQEPVHVLSIILQTKDISPPVPNSLPLVIIVALQAYCMALHGCLRTLLLKVLPFHIDIGVSSVTVMCLQSYNSNQQYGQQYVDDNLLAENDSSSPDVKAIHLIVQVM